MNLTGRSLKQYQLLGELGAGGMGVVYRARDTVLGRDVAVKVLPADKLQGDESRRRFHREARAASALNHPNVITIYEIGCVDGIDYIAMEYVSGHTLHSLLRQRPLGVAQAVGYAQQTADALVKALIAATADMDMVRALGVQTSNRPTHAVTLASAEDRVLRSLEAELLRVRSTSPNRLTARDAAEQLKQLEQETET